jgi:RimJ/RimL family protein N-acetyltransferase
MFKSWSQATDGGIGYSIARKDDNQLIGHVTLWGLIPKDRCANFGIILDKKFWAKDTALKQSC